MTKFLKTSYTIHHQVESFFTGSLIQFNQDGEHFFCAHGSVINKVSVIDGQIKAKITTKNEDDIVLRFVLSPDDKLIVIAYHSGLIMKYNLVDDTIEREFKSIHQAPISILKINQSGTLLATGSSDGTIKLWNLKNHYCSRNLKGVNGVISCIEFLQDQDSELLFCSAGDNDIHIFDIESSKRLAKLSVHCSTITDMKISLDKSRLISVGRDKIAVIWNISRSDETSFGTSIRTMPIYESIESIVVISPDDLSKILNQTVEEDRLLFATIGEEGLIKVWDAKSGSKIFTQNENPLSSDRSPGSHCFELCQRPTYNELCVVSFDRNIFIYELPYLKLIQQLQGHIDEILSACWFAGDRYLAIASNSKDLKVMEVDTSNSQHHKGHSDIILCVQPVPNDPMCLITSSKDCLILIWSFDPTTMIPIITHRATGHTNAIHSIATLDGERIFFSGGEDTTLKKWSFIEGKTKSKPEAEKPCKSLVAVQTIKAHDDRIDDIAVSPNDQIVATASRDKTAKIFSVEGLQILATLRGHRRGIHAIEFSPVDQVIVTAGDTTLRMWNLQDFTCVKTFQGHECSVLNFSFLKSGLQMISIGSDGNMKLWDCKTNECTKTIDAHTGNTWALSLTCEDKLLVTGGQDEKITIWMDTTKEEQEARLINLQAQVTQEQDFLNYINKKRWRKALKIAISMENQANTLRVLKEILLEPDGTKELEEIISKMDLYKLNFLVECCVTWSSSAKNSSTAQILLSTIFRQLDHSSLVKISSLKSQQLKDLTKKSFDRYERLVQQATFADFFMKSFRIQ